MIIVIPTGLSMMVTCQSPFDDKPAGSLHLNHSARPENTTRHPNFITTAHNGIQLKASGLRPPASPKVIHHPHTHPLF